MCAVFLIQYAYQEGLLPKALRMMMMQSGRKVADMTLVDICGNQNLCLSSVV